MHQNYQRVLKVLKPNACDNCKGKGFAVVDHVAWLSGGDVKEKDIWDCCPVCDGTGLEPEVTNELE